MRNRKIAAIVAMVLLAMFVLASCGGSNPKALAKETIELTGQALGAMFDPEKSADLEKKMKKLEAKVENLSEKDKKIYEEELTKLSAGMLEGLFDF